FQKEVAERFRAPVGKASKSIGSLSVWAQNHWEIEKLLHVAPGAFSPPPQVQSEVLLFVPRKTPQIEGSVEHKKRWESLLKRAFSQRRKMLRSVFKGTSDLSLLEKSGVDLTLRAEALSWQDWNAIVRSF